MSTETQTQHRTVTQDANRPNIHETETSGLAAQRHTTTRIRRDSTPQKTRLQIKDFPRQQTPAAHQLTFPPHNTNTIFIQVAI